MAQPTVVLYVRISPEAGDFLEKYAAATGEKKNAIVEAAIREYIAAKLWEIEKGD